MTYAEALEKLDHLRQLMEKPVSEMTQQDHNDLVITYGECEELITRIVGREEILVNVGGANGVFSNFIEAGFLSGRTFHRPAGRNQLLKVIGRVKQLAQGSHSPTIAPSYHDVVETVSRFRECCQYVRDAPQDERAVQDLLWIMLRARFDRVERDEVLPALGVKNYKPDFGLPDVGTLIEAKFVSSDSVIGRIQDELLADVPGYLKNSPRYSSLIAFIYDAAHRLRDDRKLVEGLKGIEGISDVIVIPGLA
jgi:hypothetical protein